MPEPTIAGLVLARADDANAGLVFEDITWTWAEVVRESQRRAATLSDLRRQGPFHVGVLLENVPEYVFLLFGAALAGATVVGLNPTRRGGELALDVVHTDCQAVMTDRGGASLLAGLSLGTAAGRVVLVDEDAYRARLPSGTDLSGARPLPGPDALYLLLFTAGSTGRPKAVRMSQGRAARTAAESAVAFTGRDVLYCSMP
ncbi:MAG: AMP-binding protein, partial [Acidimicrobiales bacterium]